MAWRQRLPGAGSGALTYVDGSFCGVLADSRVFCADAATGRVLWVSASRQPNDVAGAGGNPLRIPPLRWGDLWIAGTLRGTVVALHPPSPQPG